MATQTIGVKALLKQLESGKKQLKLEYEKSVRALDEAIKVLNAAKLNPSNILSSVKSQRRPGRPKKDDINIRAIVKAAKGKVGRGRPRGSSSVRKLNLTQLLHETVVSRNRFIHSRDLVDSVIKKFPDEDRTDFGKKISVLLASLKKQGRLATYKDGGYRKNMYWGIPAWLTKDGKISKGKNFVK